MSTVQVLCRLNLVLHLHFGDYTVCISYHIIILVLQPTTLFTLVLGEFVVIVEQFLHEAHVGHVIKSF